MYLATLSVALAADFRIEEVRLGAGNRLELHFPADAASYYRLLHGDAVTAIHTPVAIGLSGPLSVAAPAQAGFFRVQQLPRAAALDTDADGIPDVYELEHPPLDALNAADAGQDPDGNGRTALQEYLDSITPTPLTTITGTSPTPGESGVSVNRRWWCIFPGRWRRKPPSPRPISTPALARGSSSAASNSAPTGARPRCSSSNRSPAARA